MSRFSRQRGIALLLVLWAFMILGVLALDFGRYMRDDAMAAVNFAEETQGYYVAVAAINKALLQASKVLSGAAPEGGSATDPADEDEEQDLLPTDGEWHDGQFHGATYQVRATDECGRVAINALAQRASQGVAEDRDRLKRIITNLLYGSNQTGGKSQKQAQDVDSIVDSIIDWVDPDHLTDERRGARLVPRPTVTTGRRTGSSTRRRSCCWCAASQPICSTAAAAVPGCATSSRSSAASTTAARSARG